MSNVELAFFHSPAFPSARCPRARSFGNNVSPARHQHLPSFQVPAASRAFSSAPEKVSPRVGTGVALGVRFLSALILFCNCFMVVFLQPPELPKGPALPLMPAGHWTLWIDGSGVLHLEISCRRPDEIANSFHEASGSRTGVRRVVGEGRAHRVGLDMGPGRSR